MKWPRAMFLLYFWNILCRGIIEWKKKNFAFSYSKSMQTFKHKILISEEYNVLHSCSSVDSNTSFFSHIIAK